jgi:regulator of sigma E protease
MFSIFTFIIVLGLLVFVHEAGHFIVARRAGMDVLEFGFGFPPRIIGVTRVDGRWRFVRGEKEKSNERTNTIYSLNWVPLGGFVRIRGEDGEDRSPGSFAGATRLRRALVLVAGVVMNIVFAVVLFTVVNVAGAPQVLENLHDNARVRDTGIMIMAVLPGSAANQEGLQPGDRVVEVDGETLASSTAFQTYIQDHQRELELTIERDGTLEQYAVTPARIEGIEQVVLGVQLVDVGTVRYPVHIAFLEAGRTTWSVMAEIIQALGAILSGIFTSAPVPNDVAGPVGIAVLTGQIARLGLVHLLQFTAILSANLALLNILPIPALDGGRLLILGIEAIRRRPLAARIERTVHTAGFAFLLGLVVLVTYRDIVQFGGGIMDAAASAIGLR